MGILFRTKFNLIFLSFFLQNGTNGFRFSSFSVWASESDPDSLEERTQGETSRRAERDGRKESHRIA